jgi:hypothetical protein
MTTTTGPTQTGRAIDADAATMLWASYQECRRYGNDSVRAAWRFGQCIDSFTDAYTMGELAEIVGLSTGTLARYRRLYGAYQRPDLAVKASEQLQTFNIDLIYGLQNDLRPVGHARPMAGRRYRYRCTSCQGTEVEREEIDPETGLALELEAE